MMDIMSTNEVTFGYQVTDNYFQSLSEKNGSLPIYTTGKKVIYSVCIPEIKKDNVVSITTAFEATNNYSYNVMIGSCIQLCNSSDSVEGINIDVPNAFNISPAMHHGVINRARQFKATQDYYNQCVNVVAWASSLGAKLNDKLVIEKDYGHLDVFVHVA